MTTMDIIDFEASKSQLIGKHVILQGFLIAKRDEKRFWSFTARPTVWPVEDYIRIVVPPRRSRMGYGIHGLPEFCTIPWEANYRFQYLNQVVISGRVIREVESQEIAVEMGSINVYYTNFNALVKEYNKLSEFPLRLSITHSMADVRAQAIQLFEQPMRLSGYIVAFIQMKQLVLVEKDLVELLNENDGEPPSADMLLAQGIAIRSPLLYDILVELMGGLGPYVFFQRVNLIGTLVEDSSQMSTHPLAIQDISEVAIQFGDGDAIFHFDLSNMGVIHVD